jgi:hypothetical protein
MADTDLSESPVFEAYVNGKCHSFKIHEIYFT